MSEASGSIGWLDRVRWYSGARYSVPGTILWLRHKKEAPLSRGFPFNQVPQVDPKITTASRLIFAGCFNECLRRKLPAADSLSPLFNDALVNVPPH